MSKKMWNRIFKTKSTNKTAGISKKTPMQTPLTFSSSADNRLSYYEEFHNCRQQQPPNKEKPSLSLVAASKSCSHKAQSKFSRVVNTFTLKRNSKKNLSNQQNTMTTTVESINQNGNNYAAEENGAVVGTINTPTTAICNIPDNTIEANEEPISIELIPCPTCSRTFVPQTLEKHGRICEKMSVRKRKIFDSSRQRREGTELASYPLPQDYGFPTLKHERGISPKPIKVAPPILSPKKPPEEQNKASTIIISTTPLSSNKMTSPLSTSILLESQAGHSNSVVKVHPRVATVPKRIQRSPAEPCPYCDRCFGVKAYDRHVEWCKEKALIASIKQNITNSQVAAKERLEARIKYRAPCLKTKRSVNRNKYSCQNDEHYDMQTSVGGNYQKTSLMTSSMNSSFTSDGKIDSLKNISTKYDNKKLFKQLESSKRMRSHKDSENWKISGQTTYETLKSLSTDTILKTAANFPINDVESEQFSKEFQNKTSLERIKFHANTQASHKKQRASTKRESQPFSAEKISKSKTCGSNTRRIIKKSTVFIASKCSSTSPPQLQCHLKSKVAAEQVPGRLPKNKSFIVSGLSDSYDPFIFAKRQLEELCSPSSQSNGQFSPCNFVPPSKTPTHSDIYSSLNKMTTSFTSRTSLTNPRQVVTTPKSNFHRTSSLRAPRRSPIPMSTRPIFFPSSQNQRPTIQRGLSDEGPISSKFIKPEEFDEMPVRAACVNDFAISNTPRVIRRDTNAAANRKNLRPNLHSTTQKSKDGSPAPSTGVSNRSLLKTDSLSVFLKYEHEAKAGENSVVNTKELKDKSNNLSKQNSAKSVNSTDGMSETPIADNLNIKHGNLNTIRLDPIARSVTDTLSPSITSRQSLTLVDKDKTSQPVKLDSIFDKTVDSDYINPKLINVCDNLSIEFGNDLKSNSSSPPSHSGGGRNNCGSEKLDQTENMSYQSSCANTNPSSITKDLSTESLSQTTSVDKNCRHSNRTSNENARNQLKRKIRMGRNQFLYDNSPEAGDNDADDEGNNRSRQPDRRKLLEQTLPTLTATETNLNIPTFSPSTFDEFDFEDFLSAFDNDDEQFPSLFKDCREFLMNRSTLNKCSNTDRMPSYRSTQDIPCNSARKYEQDEEHNRNSEENKNHGEIFISIETDQNENYTHPKIDPLVAANPSAQIEEVKLNDHKFQKIDDDEITDCHLNVENGDKDKQLRMRRINLLNDFPNVILNNAKNLIQRMHEDFPDMDSAPNVEGDVNGNTTRQIAGGAPYLVDSDEISSIEAYPVRRGGAVGGNDITVQSKHSADSAYGSLSRQSPSTDTNYHSSFSHRNRSRSEQLGSPGACHSVFQYPTSIPYKYSTSTKNDDQKYRCHNFTAGSSSSGSDNSLPPVVNNKNPSGARKDYQSQVKEFKRSFHREPASSPSLENKTQTIKKTVCTSNSTSNNNLNTLTKATVKASKFCHECGSRFLLDQAKFCMDCGVRRIVIK